MAARAADKVTKVMMVGTHSSVIRVQWMVAGCSLLAVLSDVVRTYKLSGTENKTLKHGHTINEYDNRQHSTQPLITHSYLINSQRLSSRSITENRFIFQLKKKHHASSWKGRGALDSIDNLD
jgi:hypothetical protein